MMMVMLVVVVEKPMSSNPQSTMQAVSIDLGPVLVRHGYHHFVPSLDDLHIFALDSNIPCACTCSCSLHLFVVVISSHLVCTGHT